MKDKRRIYAISVSALLTTVLFFTMFSGAAQAAGYPNKPITLVIPYDLGQGDTEARMFGKIFEKYIGQPVVGTNITGGSGGVGLQHVMQAEPDGYTIGFMSSTIAFGMAKGNIKIPPQNVEVLGSFNADWMGLFVPAKSPFRTFQELVTYAKEKPGELLIGGTNVASAHHSFLVTLCKDAGIEVQYVPYGGSTDTTLALLGGNLDGAVFSPNSIRQYMESDGVRLLVYSTKDRVEEFKDVPTGYELGYKHLDDMIQFRAYYTVPGVPEEILKVMDEAFKKAVYDPEYQKYLKENGLMTFYKNRKEFASYFVDFVETAKASFSEIGELPGK
jgi:tripartite-type tricarboxylate transporter receptor subunit TctC